MVMSKLYKVEYTITGSYQINSDMFDFDSEEENNADNIKKIESEDHSNKGALLDADENGKVILTVTEL